MIRLPAAPLVVAIVSSVSLVCGVSVAIVGLASCSGGASFDLPPPPDGQAPSVTGSRRGAMRSPDGPAGSVDQVAVVSGVADRNRDPAVVALDVNGELLCAGTLIAPRVVVTARHCLSRTEEPVVCTPPGGLVTADRDPKGIVVLSGDDAQTGTPVAQGQEIVTAQSGTLCGEDMALLVLDREVTTIQPLLLSKNHVGIGDKVRAVGYAKRAGSGLPELKLVREHLAVLTKDTVEFEVAGATCRQGWGGPAIEEATGAVLGVVSRRGPACDVAPPRASGGSDAGAATDAGDDRDASDSGGPGGLEAHEIYSRIDAHPEMVQRALVRALELSKETAGPGAAGASSSNGTSKKKKSAPPGKPDTDLGSTCAHAEECSTGVCLNDGMRAYCSRRCGNGDRCPAHYHCRKVSGTQVCQAAS